MLYSDKWLLESGCPKDKWFQKNNSRTDIIWTSTTESGPVSTKGYWSEGPVLLNFRFDL